MLRPCFLVIDREHFGSISTRKLVLETAKFNVITAYSGEEAIQALEKFPRVDAAVLDVTPHEGPAGELVKRLKQVQPQLTVIAVGEYGCFGADHSVDSFDPKSLLELLENLHAEQIAQLLQHEAMLSEQQ